MILVAQQQCLPVQAEESEPSDFEFEEEQARDAAESDEEDELSVDDESGMSLPLLLYSGKLSLEVLCCVLRRPQVQPG